MSLSREDPHAALVRTSFFRFYEELNDFLPLARRRVSFAYGFKGRPSIKNTLAALGVPHAEIDLLLVDGRSVDFNYRLQGQEHVSVYPMFECFDIGAITRLKHRPLRDSKFIVDVNLGKLATQLRLLGFDSLYRSDFADREIVALSLAEQRIILTRDKGILHYNSVSHGYWVRSTDVRVQIQEVIERFQLEHKLAPFSRCPLCNTVLQAIDKAEVRGRVPPGAFGCYEAYKECPRCRKIYWQGSHYRQICRRIAALRASLHSAGARPQDVNGGKD
ncbi:Mut7-C ubiquitin/RNAse domain-containing protein [Shewanella sp. AS16]|uniref:Mut7-C ubiquitin/RNAse domain-containing protein n=1 Tax=Shewanella sp. AS16 TaxID=2907625 RepID=UPI001F18B2B6|nr:Mut7-C ubiquitin/RNAse domain-containing protein [Shewanella sp. AS16]MCE9686365.1 Mut7-C ubiquitin/RNAse domain-containing protein [Shewanella sp. AS16]